MKRDKALDTWSKRLSTAWYLWLIIAGIISVGIWAGSKPSRADVESVKSLIPPLVERTGRLETFRDDVKDELHTMHDEFHDMQSDIKRLLQRR